MKYYFLTFALILGFAACEKSDMTVTPSQDEIQADVMVDAMTSFQWELFRESVAHADADTNVIISPLSVASALYLTLEGAAGVTRSEMEAALAMKQIDGKDLGQAFAELMHLMESTDDATRLSWSNAVFWDDLSIDPHEQFMDYTKTHFDATQEGMSFADTELALNTINSWVNSATEGRIEKILEEISSDEVMFLINAIFFTGDWDNPFAETLTRDRNFTTGSGEDIEVPTMSKDAQLQFSIREDYSAVQLPFSDSSYAMTFIIPAEGTDIDDFISGFSDQDLEELDADLNKSRVQLYLPRFEISYNQRLNSVLKNLGIEKAFDKSQADFSNLGVARGGNLFISRVNHEAFLKIDEKGAEGAAVTSVGIGVTSLPPTVSFDRPFVILLRNTNTDILLFAGKIENPAGK